MFIKNNWTDGHDLNANKCKYVTRFVISCALFYQMAKRSLPDNKNSRHSARPANVNISLFFWLWTYRFMWRSTSLFSIDSCLHFQCNLIKSFYITILWHYFGIYWWCRNLNCNHCLLSADKSKLVNTRETNISSSSVSQGRFLNKMFFWH